MRVGLYHCLVGLEGWIVTYSSKTAKREPSSIVSTWEFASLVEDGTTLATGFFRVHAIK